MTHPTDKSDSAAETIPTHRFHFGLKELLFVIFFIGVGMFILVPYWLTKGQMCGSNTWGPELRSEMYAAGILILILNSLAAILGFYLCRRNKIGTQSRLILVGTLMLGASLTPICCHQVFLSILRSRMAANESAAVAACKTYAEAQDIFRRTDWDKNGVLEYAQTITDTKNDPYSLYGENAEHSCDWLIDSAFAKASLPRGQATPKAGYFFKLLSAQGPNAPGGSKSYVDQDGNMTLGYGLVAYPSSYLSTGINSFIINNTGTVYQMDLGCDTTSIAETMRAYNPPSDSLVAE